MQLFFIFDGNKWKRFTKRPVKNSSSGFSDRPVSAVDAKSFQTATGRFRFEDEPMEVFFLDLVKLSI